MALLPIITYEYVPPGGDPSTPIKILGRQEYSPGDHSGRIDEYSIELPDGVLSALSDRQHNAQSKDHLLQKLAGWFEGETKNGVDASLKVVQADKIQFPRAPINR